MQRRVEAAMMKERRPVSCCVEGGGGRRLDINGTKYGDERRFRVVGDRRHQSFALPPVKYSAERERAKH